MKSRLIILFLFFNFYSLITTAQTVIKIPFVQPDAFVVQPKVVYKSFGGNTTIEIGSETEIVGGSGTYLFTWTKNGVIIGNNPTLSISEKGEYTLTITDGVSCGSSSAYLVDTTVSGINNLDRADVQIYPNPSSGMFYVQYPEFQHLDKIEIYDIEGKLLNSYPVDKTNVNELGIDASELSPGQYLLVSHFEVKRITKILIIN